MANQNGRWVWYDLMTRDVEASKAFYTETIGWKITPWEGGEMPYEMFTVGDQSLGGIMKMPPEIPAQVPSHWIAYVQVADVDAAANKAKELGGSVAKGAFDIPGVGRVAVLADPQGAVFSVFKPSGEMTLNDGKPRPGEITWHELNTTDWQSAWKFYSTLLGWKKTDDMDMGPEMGTYRMYQRDGAPGSTGGISNAAAGMGAPAHWLYYISVDDLDAAVGRVQQRGGKVLNGPMEVPGGDKVAQCQDPQGAFFALHWSKPE